MPEVGVAINAYNSRHCSIVILATTAAVVFASPSGVNQEHFFPHETEQFMRLFRYGVVALDIYRVTVLPNGSHVLRNAKLDNYIHSVTCMMTSSSCSSCFVGIVNFVAMVAAVLVVAFCCFVTFVICCCCRRCLFCCSICCYCLSLVVFVLLLHCHGFQNVFFL